MLPAHDVETALPLTIAQASRVPSLPSHSPTLVVTSVILV